jgi:hypothetical protein
MTKEKIIKKNIKEAVTVVDNNIKKNEQPTIERIKQELSSKYVYIDDLLEVLDVGFSLNKNVILWGNGGFGKSNIAQEFFKALGIQPFIKTMGSGTTTDSLFGGIDLNLLNKTGKIEFLLENSFMNHEFVIFEELFDANDYIIEQCKDILSSGMFRNGNQQFKIKTKFIICCTNRSRDEFAKNRSLKALMERFPLELEVKWKEHTAVQYEKLFNTVKGVSDPLLVFVLQEYAKKGTIISPRIALVAHDLLIKCGPDCLKYLADFKSKIEILTDAIEKFKSIIDFKELITKTEDLFETIQKIKFEETNAVSDANKIIKLIEINISKIDSLKLDDTIATQAPQVKKKFISMLDTFKKNMALLSVITPKEDDLVF